MLKILQPLRDDLSAHCCRFLRLEFGNGDEMAPVLVTVRAVQQQIFDGNDLQPFKLRGALRTNARKFANRRFNRELGRNGHGCFLRFNVPGSKFKVRAHDSVSRPATT